MNRKAKIEWDLVLGVSVFLVLAALIGGLIFSIGKEPKEHHSYIASRRPTAIRPGDTVTFQGKPYLVAMVLGSDKRSSRPTPEPCADTADDKTYAFTIRLMRADTSTFEVDLSLIKKN